MTEYTIAAIPTMYRGRQYRSRLEAKWAAFFDALGWRHEYEPFDLGSWSPDFRLLGYRGTPALVEVKPIDRLDDGTCAKMYSAALSANFTGPLLLLGNSPGVTPNSSAADACDIVTLGWHCVVGEDDPGWDVTMMAWSVDPSIPVLMPEILHIARYPPIPSWSGFFTNSGGSYAEFEKMLSYPNYTLELWARACNAVQYLRPESKQ